MAASVSNGDLESLLFSMLMECARERGNLELRVDIRGGYITRILTGPMTKERLELLDGAFTHQVKTSAAVPKSPFQKIDFSKRSKKK